MLKLFFGSMIGKIIAAALVALVVSGVTYHFFKLGQIAGEKAKVERQRDDAFTWINNVCASVATPQQAKPELYRPACAETIRRLFNFYSSANSATTKALVQAEQDRVKKLEQDNLIRAQNERVLASQLRRLREISVNVKDNQVGPDYWAAVNRVAGLPAQTAEVGRSDPGSTSDRGGHVDSAEAPDRIADVLAAAERVPGNQ